MTTTFEIISVLKVDAKHSVNYMKTIRRGQRVKESIGLNADQREREDVLPGRSAADEGRWRRASSHFYHKVSSDPLMAAIMRVQMAAPPTHTQGIQIYIIISVRIPSSFLSSQCLFLSLALFLSPSVSPSLFIFFHFEVLKHHHPYHPHHHRLHPHHQRTPYPFSWTCH